MARPKMVAGTARTDKIEVYVTPGFRAALQRSARAARLGMSAYVRQCLERCQKADRRRAGNGRKPDAKRGR